VRLAANLLGAAQMNRPEDVQPHPSNGKVFVLLTSNAQRRTEQVDKTNPRPENEVSARSPYAAVATAK